MSITMTSTDPFRDSTPEDMKRAIAASMEEYIAQPMDEEVIMEQADLYQYIKQPETFTQRQYASASSNDSRSISDPTREAYLIAAARRAAEEADQSLDSLRPESSSGPSEEVADTAGPESPARRRNIDDCIQQLMSTTKFIAPPRPNHSSADTAVFIDAPPSETESFLDKEVRQLFAGPFFVRSKNVKALGSEYFDSLLGPTETFRIKRRRHAQIKRIQAERPGITYFIDLTPKLEGDLAAMTVAELSLPLGVRLWALSAERWGVGSALVGGEDDFRIKQELYHPSQYPDSVTQPSSPEVGTQDPFKAVETSKTPSKAKPVFQMPPEYSALRHRASIQRILLAIEGLDPELDSAPKVYSVAVLSKMYGITQNPLTDYVVRWLRASPNSVFLEVLPEVALRMAECVQAEDVARDAFAILTGEEILDMAVEEHETLSKGYTVHQRRKEAVDEEWQTRIQHARLSFIERAQNRFDSLVSENMTWVESLSEYQKVQELNHPEGRHYKQCLKDFVKSGIYHLLFDDHPTLNAREINNRDGGDRLFPRTSLKDTWAELSPRKRIFTRSFWELLSVASFQSLTGNKMGETLHCQDNSYNLDTGNSIDFLETTQYFPAAGIKNLVTFNELETLKGLAYGSSTFEQPLPCSQKAPQTLVSAPVNVSTSIPLPDVGTNDKLWNECLSAVSSSNAASMDNMHVSSDDIQSTAQDGPVLPFRTASATTLPIPIPQTSTYTTSQVAREVKIATGADFLSPPPLLDPFLGNPRHAQRHFQHQASRADCLNTQQTNALLAKEGAGWSNIYMAQFGDKSLPVSKSKRVPKDTLNVLDMRLFLAEVEFELRRVAGSMLAFPDGSIRDESELYVTDVLLCINEAETKFLPLWAGGLDDGSNGVFAPDIPFADHGFTAAGPHIHGLETSSRSSSEYDMMDGSSTVGSSVFVNDGYSDAMDRRRVYTPDELSTDDSDSIAWSEVCGNVARMKSAGSEHDDTEEDSEFEAITPQGAMKEPDLAAADAALGGTKVEEKEATRDSKQDAMMEDTYEDIFNGSDENDDFDDGDDDMDDENEDGFIEDFSYHGFGVASSTSSQRNEIMEDVGECSGKGKQDVRALHGSMAMSESTGIIVYKKSIEEQDADRP